VPGCSTGEEAYSLAISLVEYLGRKATDIPFQIFASDLSNWAIDKARTGKYPENIAQDLSPERLKRFFVRVDSGYQVVKSIRERCVFARHDLTRDPPFSNLDLISCRNVLIYMGPVLQKRAMAVFHYSLKPTGYLLLGKSEAVGRYPDLFTPVDRKFKIYSRKPTSGRPAINLPHRGFGTGKTDIRTDTGDGGFDFKKEADLILLSKAPAGVIVDDRLEIIHFHGQTGHYLEPPPGDASFNLLRMAREGIKLTLRTAIHKAKKQGAPVRNEGLQVKFNGHLKEVNIEVIPLKASHPGEGYLLILFEDRPVLPLGEPDAWKTRPARDKGTRRRTDRPEEKAEVSRLEQELEATKKHLQSIIEESDTLNEEMRAANEEVQSSNEELQSLNEELETSKEELESTNEELTTLNDELQNRNIALDQLNNDVINLLTSVNLPVIMLESDLCIRRFTPIAAKLLSLTPTDIGRSITHVRLGMNIPGLETSILEVINTGVIKEAEVQDWEGIWYSMRISPYRTVENRIGGAVLTWLDIHALKRSVELTKESRDYAEAIVETVREPLVVLDGSLRVKTANRSFYRIFQTLPGETEGRLFYELGNRQWDMPELRSLFEEILSQGTSFQDFDVEIDFPAIGHKAMQLNAKPIVRGDGGTQMILLAIEDVTEQKRMEEIMRESEVSRRLSSRVMGAQEEERKRMAHEIHDGIGQSLSAAKFKIESILKKAEKDEGEAGAHLYEAILPILHENIEEARRIQMGLRPSILDDMGILPTITWFCREFQKTYPNIRIETDVTIKEEEVSSFLKTTAYRLMQEALNNVAKHSKADLVYLALHKVDDKIQLKIRDNGKGFDVKEALSIESSRRGFGLTSMRERVEISGGVFALESVEGKGTTITASWKVADKPF